MTLRRSTECVKSCSCNPDGSLNQNIKSPPLGPVAQQIEQNTSNV